MKAFLIIVIVILAIAIAGGAYFIIKETINPEAISSPSTTATTSVSGSPSGSTDLQKAYDEAQDVEASTNKSKTVDGEVKPILKSVFTEQVKLKEDMAGSLLTYITNREIKAEDVTTTKTKMEAAGYAAIDTSEKKLTMTKGATTLVFTFSVQDKTKALIEITL